MNWNYRREESEYQQIPEGDYRIRISSAEKGIAKSSGNDMLTLKFNVSGYRQFLWHHISFLVDRPEITNRMLTAFFDSFRDIEDGNFNMSSWIGKVGACHIKHDEQGRAKLSYFIKADKQDSLPPWKEVDGMKPTAAQQAPVVNADGFMQVTGGEDGLPF